MRKFFFSSLAGAMLFLPFVVGAIEINPPGGKTTLISIINGLINTSLKIILPIAVIVILVAAFFILRSNGDSNKSASGKKILTYGLVGLAVVIIGAGSGALLKNIFGDIIKTEVPGVTYALPSAFGLSPYLTPGEYKYWAGVFGDKASELMTELAKAQQEGDTEKINSLTSQIQEYQEAQRSLSLYSQEMERVEDSNIMARFNNLKDSMFTASTGLTLLKAYGTKDSNGLYIMKDGSKYNEETGEYITPDGKVYTDTTVMTDGTILYCGQ